MKEIGQHLKKFANLVSHDSKSRKIILDEIAVTLGHGLIKKINFQNGELAIQEKPILKNEILLHKEEIISRLLKRGIRVRVLL